LACKVTVFQVHFLQIQSKCLIVFVETNNPVNYLRPIVQSVFVANKEIIFIEDSENALSEGLDK
jgi:hypothetical protein